MHSPPSSYDAIQQRLARYTLGFDEADFEMLADCFTEDAAVQFPAHRGGDRLEGRDALLERYRAMRGRRGGVSRMMVSNVVLLEESADDALAVSYVTAVTTDADGVRITRTGWYRDRLVREADGAWRIRERTVGGDEPEPTSSPLDA